MEKESIENQSEEKLLMPPAPAPLIPSLPSPAATPIPSPPRISAIKPLPVMQWRVYAHDPSEEILWTRLAIIGVVSAALVAIFTLQKDYTGAATFFLAGALAALFISRRPPIISCEIYPENIVFQKDKYAFSSLKSFALTFDRLVLFPKQEDNNIQIPIEPDEQDDIRKVLAPHLEETEYEPTVLDFLYSFLKI